MSNQCHKHFDYNKVENKSKNQRLLTLSLQWFGKLCHFVEYAYHIKVHVGSWRKVKLKLSVN
jgi:hypothetical protein